MNHLLGGPYPYAVEVFDANEMHTRELSCWAWSAADAFFQMDLQLSKTSPRRTVITGVRPFLLSELTPEDHEQLERLRKAPR